MDDWRLIRDYLENNSEAAFTELLNRHLGLVYSAALRRVNNPDAAQDVTQTVFCLLAQKARELPESTVLVGWLYRTACLKACEFCRSERRRLRREQTFAMDPNTATDRNREWEHLAPHLDDAMEQLEDEDRLAILLRFFRRESLKEIGRVLGTSEDAARMRINRALERLRNLLATRGIHSASAVLAAMLVRRSVEAAPTQVFNMTRAAALQTSNVGTQTGSSSFSMGAQAKLLIPVVAMFSVGIATVLLFQKDDVVRLEDGPQMPAAQESTAEHLPNPVPIGNLAPLQQEMPVSTVADALGQLRQLLYSKVPDLSYPSPGLKEAVACLKGYPAETVMLLSEALRSDLQEARSRAACAFGLVGPDAIEALPMLLDKAHSDPDLAYSLFSSAVLIDPDADLLKHFIEICRAAPTELQGVYLWATGNAIRTLTEADTDLAPEVRRILVELLTDPDPELRLMAALRLTELPGEMNLAAITELTAALGPVHDLEVIQALKAYGPAAKAAIPAIRHFRATVTDPRLHALATETLAAIAPELGEREADIAEQLDRKQKEALLSRRIEAGEASVEDLVSGLDFSWAIRGQVYADLKRLGSAAAAALPALHLQFEQAQQGYVVGGLTYELIATTIKAINPESPMIWFSHDQILPALRAVADAGAVVVRRGGFDAPPLTAGYTYPQLKALVDQLRDVDPSLAELFIDKFRTIDEKTADLLAPH
jgi:RNA polymerase sigma factor (sigma-70 family)